MDTSGITFTAICNNTIPSLSHQNSTVSLTPSSNTANGHGTSPQKPGFTTVEDQPTATLTVTTVPVRPVWDPTHIVVDALKMHAELGDVQTAACVLLALGELRYEMFLIMIIKSVYNIYDKLIITEILSICIWTK